MLEGIYRVGMLVGPFAALPAFWASARGRRKLSERFGAWEPPAIGQERPLWFHGASFGEVNGLLPIIRALGKLEEHLPVLLSATSVTGLDVGGRVAQSIRLLPFDHPLWIKRALAKVSPRAFIFGETEVWPMLLDELTKRCVPCVLVNGRISDRAFPRYMRWKSFLEPRLKRLARICVSGEEARERFMALGAEAHQIVITGNAKYDLTPALTDRVAIQLFREQFFPDDRPVIVLGSLRPGEEQEWFPVLRSILEEHPRLGVIVAPRHKERFSFFSEQLAAHRISFRRRSDFTTRNASNESVILLDTLGELASVYSFADAGFVGGTLRDFGGHNPLEPAAHGAAVVLGPYFQNAGEVVARLRSERAVFELSDQESLRRLLLLIIGRDPSISEVRARGLEVWKSMQGATERVVAEIRQAAPSAILVSGRGIGSTQR